MTNYREILRLRSLGLNHSRILAKIRDFGRMLSPLRLRRCRVTEIMK